MKIVRHGNPKGLDIDYKVFVDSVVEIRDLHMHLMKSGYYFLYQKGDIPYTPDSESLVVLHYIDKNLKLYDFAFIFPDTPKKTEERLKSEFDIELDKAYAKAKYDSVFRDNLMKYMRLHVLLQAFAKHLKAYKTMTAPYEVLFKKVLARVKRQTKLELDGHTIEAIRNLDRHVKQFFRV
jgi:hypothetical protein